MKSGFVQSLSSKSLPDMLYKQRPSSDQSQSNKHLPGKKYKLYSSHTSHIFLQHKMHICWHLLCQRQWKKCQDCMMCIQETPCRTPMNMPLARSTRMNSRMTGRYQHSTYQGLPICMNCLTGPLQWTNMSQKSRRHRLTPG